MSQQAFYSQSQSSRNPNQRHPICQRCGSRKWRRDPNRGAVVCAEGHVLEGFLRESTEQTEVSQHSVRRRRLKVGPKERKHYILKSTYEGQQARILLLQTMTVVLRKQIEALIQIIQAPIQLEEIGKSLWKSYLLALELDDDVFVNTRTRSESPTAPTSRFADNSNVIDWLYEEADLNQNDPSSSTSSHQNKTQLDPESLKEIAHDSSHSSDDSLPISVPSSPASSDENLRDKLSLSKKRKQVENVRVHPRMEVTICTLFLACLKLRIPIILQDIINFIVTKQLPYIGILNCVPHAIKQKMNRSVMETFWIEKPPRLFYRQDDNNGLLSVCHQLIKLFHHSNPTVLSPENTIPNLTLMVLRFSRVLMLPKSLQLICIHLLEKLDTFCVNYNPLNTNPSTSRQRPPIRQSIAKRSVLKYPPEWFIMAVVYLVAHSAILHYSNSHQPIHDAETYRNDNRKEMLNSIIDGLPKPSQWYRDLMHEIECDNDKNPQKLWEKNIAELDSKEIDSYIELAKAFLLKDEPEANKSSFKDQYFPLLQDSGCDREEEGAENDQREVILGQRTVNDQMTVSPGREVYDPNLHNDGNPVNNTSTQQNSIRENNRKVERRQIELLKELLLDRASEFVGCSTTNHSNINEFIKVLSFVNSMISKRLI